MDGREKVQKHSEISMTDKRGANGAEVVIPISSNEETPRGSVSMDREPFVRGTSEPNSPFKESATAVVPKSAPLSCPSPELPRTPHSAGRPPRPSNENLLRKRSLTRSVYSKPKSRFGEPPPPADASLLEENNLNVQGVAVSSPLRNSLNRGSPNNKSAANITPKTPLMASPGGPADEEDETEIFAKIEASKKKRSRISPLVLVELIIFFCILGCLIASLVVESLKKHIIWGLEVWKWCVMVMVIFSGMLVTNWFMHFVVFLIEINFLLKKKVLYFVHGLKKSVQVFIWIGLVLLAWSLLFNRGVRRSKKVNKILDYVTWTLVSLLIGSFLWLVKTLLLKILASNFHVNTFFDRIQESVFHQYVLQTLSGPPLIEKAERVGRSASTGRLSFRVNKKGKGKGPKETKVIDIANLHKMKQGKVSAWTMKVLVDAVTNSGLSTISNTLESFDDEGAEQTDKEITNEMEATLAAYRIFRNVAQPGCKYIDEEDLLRFMIKEEVDLVFPLFEGFETGRIERKALIDWVVKVYNGRKALAHALTDTKTAVKQLNKLVTGILVVITIVIWLLLMEIASTKFFLFLSSQLVVAAFMFGNTCKTLFEAIVFVFVMHPFDVGDRCVVDGVPLLVEEMNLLTTVFLKLNNEKVYYPNSVLATKPISNYYRSPNMGDTVEFSIGFATPVEKIALLREKIKQYLENNPQHWHANHNVVVKEIENLNELHMALYPNHTMNFQEWGEKNKRRTELVIAMKRIFEELNIEYNLPLQKVHITSARSDLTKLANI